MLVAEVTIKRKLSEMDSPRADLAGFAQSNGAATTSAVLRRMLRVSLPWGGESDNHVAAQESLCTVTLRFRL